MRFCALEMKGIRHFSHRKIDFAEGLNIVYGPNESGKSTIMDSLLAAILSPTRKEIGSLVQWNATHSEIKLTYTANSGTFTITRVFHPAARVLLEGEDLILEDSQEIQNTLEVHLGFDDRSLFENSAVVKQNEMQILQEEDSRMIVRDKMRALISGVPERPTEEALAFLETSIRKTESFLKSVEEKIPSMESELLLYRGAEEELKNVETRLNVYQSDLQRDQSLLQGYEVLLKYREAEREYKSLAKVLEWVENLEGYMRKLPVREKELICKLQEELEKISAQQDTLIEQKARARGELAGEKEKLSTIDDELEGVKPEKRTIFSRLSSLIARSSRAKQEELAARRVEVSQNVARLEDLSEQYEEQITELRRKFQEKGERLRHLLEECGEYENWSIDMLEARKKEYESKIEETLRGVTREELEREIELRRREADSTRAALVKDYPDLKERKDTERIQIEKQKLAEIIMEWREKISGLEAQIELLSSRAKKRKVLAEELEKLEKERKEKIIQMRADEIAHDVITLVYHDLKEEFAPELERRAEALLSRITQGRYQDITIRREDLDVQVKVPEKGESVDVDVLSQGTRDQLYLSLRIALSELLSGDKNPPLLFDEAFYTFDEDRLKETLRVLEEIAHTTQVIVFTHDESYAHYGNPIPLKKR